MQVTGEKEHGLRFPIKSGQSGTLFWKKKIRTESIICLNILPPVIHLSKEI